MLAKAPQVGDSAVVRDQIFGDNAEMINRGASADNNSDSLTSVNITANDIYIATKFSATEDMIVRFSYIPNNGVKGFKESFTIPNTDSLPVANPKDYSLSSTGADLLAYAVSEYVGPVSTQWGWTGGSHPHNGHNTGDVVAFLAVCDGVILSEDDSGYFASVSVQIQNNLYRPDTLPTKNKIIAEHQIFEVRNNTLECWVELAYLASFAVNTYYGLQTDGKDYFDTAYYSNSQHGTPQTYADLSDSGTIADYPHVDFAVQQNTDKSKSQIMWMDRQYGLGASSDAGTTAKGCFRAGSKVYFTLIKAKNVQTATSDRWHGAYSWSKGAGTGICAHTLNLKSGKKVALAVEAGQASRIYTTNPDDIGKEIKEVADSNQNGLILWNQYVNPWEKTIKTSSSVASSSIYNVSDR